MTTAALRDATAGSSQRANELADRLEQGAAALASLAIGLTDTEWNTRIPHDGRKAGVVVHHVASMYPIEMGVVKAIAGGEPVQGLTWDVVAGINAEHSSKFDGVSKDAALQLLRQNSKAAADTIRALSDEELDRAVTNSLYFNAPLTCQFFIEDHPLRHSFHHLGKIKNALKR